MNLEPLGARHGHRRRADVDGYIRHRYGTLIGFCRLAAALLGEAEARDAEQGHDS